jgi:excisionase family DNA binding protein
MDKLYTIQEVAIKLGLSDKTLRRWEEAGRFTPNRTLGNQRRYSIEDLQILDAIKHGTVDTQKDLLTIDQACRLCGISPTTMLRYEDSGKIHPIITSVKTYFPRAKLMAKIDEIKKLPVEPVCASPTLSATPPSVPIHDPRLQSTIYDLPARSTITTLSHPHPPPYYHFSSTLPLSISPLPGSVQASTTPG